MKMAEQDQGQMRGIVETIPSTQTRPASSHPAAVLWVPDPEQRHGWREFYVYPDAWQKPSGKRLGF